MSSGGEAAKDWYSTPRENRTRIRAREKIGPPRKLERLNNNVNLPGERETAMETIQKT